jgi:hypothetical protein
VKKLLALVFIASSSSAFAQSSISTYDQWNKSDLVFTVSSDGQPISYMYGQSFTVGNDNVLTDFTVWTKQGGNTSPGSTIAKVYQWDKVNKTVIGSALFMSDIHTVGSTTDFAPTTIGTNNLSLTSGTEYIFSFENNPQSLGAHWGVSQYNYLPSGEFYVANDVTPWFLPFGDPDVFDLAFTANFTSSNPTNNAVPEPSEWAAMGLFGAGLLGLVVRGRKKNLAN